MVDSIRKGDLELWGPNVEREIRNEKNLAHCWIRTRGLPLTKRRRYHWCRKTDVCWVNKTSPGFNCAILRNLPAAHGRWSKIISVIYVTAHRCAGGLKTVYWSENLESTSREYEFQLNNLWFIESTSSRNKVQFKWNLLMKTKLR